MMIYEPKGKAREYAPLAANLYKGCGHGCLYCYAPKATFCDREKFHTEISIRKNAISELEKDAKKIKCGTVLFSFTSDPYQPAEEETKLTRSGIEVLHRNGLNVEILTKGGTRACRDFDMLGENDPFATSLTFLDDRDSLAWEPQAALPSDRLNAIKEAKKIGIPTWASFEPVIDSKQSLELMRLSLPFVDFFKIGKLNHHPAAKNIDWKQFALAAIVIMENAGKKYYIKNDLRKFIE